MEFPSTYSIEHLLGNAEDSDSEFDDEEQYKCKICKKEFAKKDLLKSHQKTHGPRVFACLICDFKFTTKKYLALHTKRKHTDKAKSHKFKCDFCEKLFFSNKVLKQHELIHTGEKPNKCEICGKCFRAEYTLRSHMLIHTGEKPYKCAFCEYACRDNSTLRKHQERHLGIVTKIKCTECNKSFDKKLQLRVHVDEVHLKKDVRKFKCDECGKGYKFKARLNEHKVRCHTTKLSIKCEICHRTISNKYNLHQHMQTHNTYKPYKCGVDNCTIRFKTKEDCRRHRIKHFPDQQHKCDKCDARFITRFKLKRHTKAVHRYKPPQFKHVECDHCGDKFYSKTYLKKHIKIKHDMSLPLLCCDHCEFTSRWKPSLIMHMKGSHLKEYFPTCYVCKVCGNEYDTRKIFRHHMSKYHNIRLRRKLQLRNEFGNKSSVIVKEELIDIEESNLNDVLEEAELVEIPLSENTVLRDLVDTVDVNVKSDDENTLRHLDEQVYDRYKHTYREVRLKISPKPRNPFADKKLMLKPIVLLDRSIADNYKNNPVVNKKETEALKRDADRELKSKQIEALEMLRCSYNERLVEIIELRKIQEQSLKRNKVVYKRVKVNKDDVENEDEKCNINTYIENNDNNSAQVNDSFDDNSGESTKDFLNNTTQNSSQEENHVTNEDNKNNKMKTNEISVDNDDSGDEKDVIQNDDDGVGNEDNDSTEETVSLNKTMEADKVEMNNKGIETIHSRIISKNTGNMFKNNTQNSCFTEEKSDLNVNIKELSKTIQKNNDSTVTGQSEEDINICNSKENSVDLKNVNEGHKELKKLNPRKIIFNTAQCYVCFKLFPSKEDLVKHCQTHFDVCSLKKLIKCPLCPYVGRQYIKRHIITAHNIKLDIKYSKINKNDDISVYTQEVLHQENLKQESGNSKVSVSQIEVIPSVNNLNRNECMKLDSEIRNRKKMNTFENVLVRKGTEWIVSREVVKIDLEKHMFPKIMKTHKINSVFKFKDDNPYIEDLMKLRAQARRDNIDIVFPCNACTKICRNIAALKAHIKTHDNTIKYKKRPKEFMDKYFKTNEIGKNKNSSKVKKKSRKEISGNSEVSGNSVKSGNSTTGNLPKTKEEVVEFFNNNIGGSERELQEFLKIFTQIDKVDKNEFSVMEHNEDFGVQ